MNWSAEASTYFAEHAIDPTLAAELGITERNGSLIFTYKREDGSTFQRKRSLNGAGKVLQPENEPLTLWCPDGRAGAVRVLVCEGEFDTLSALTTLRGLPESLQLPVVGIPGTGFPSDRLPRALKARADHAA